MSEPVRKRLQYCIAMGTAHLHIPIPRYDPVENTITSEPGTIEYRDRHWLEVWEMSDGTLGIERVDTPSPIGLAGEPV